MKTLKPIGFFDSGVGGISIWKKTRQLLPNEYTVYLADSANAPYGPKGKEQIIKLSEKNTQLLIKMGCKMIVVACNTATTNAIATLRKKYPIPFIGIEPAIKPAALKTKTGVIGILATEGTLSSSMFHNTANLYASKIKVVEKIGKGLVPLIEQAKINSEQTKNLLETYLEPMLKAKADHIVLGCSHYAHLIPLLKKILGDKICILDASEAVAKQSKAILQQNNLLNNSSIEKKPTHQLYTNGREELLKKIIAEDLPITYMNF